MKHDEPKRLIMLQTSFHLCRFHHPTNRWDVRRGGGVGDDADEGGRVRDGDQRNGGPGGGGGGGLQPS